MYTSNNNSKVAVTALSMGTTVFMNFLNRFVDYQWKSKYIHSFTPLSTVFGGSSSALAATVFSNNYANAGIFTAEEIKELTSSWSSIAW